LTEKSREYIVIEKKIDFLSFVNLLIYNACIIFVA
jgi:hypothetical protein